MATLIADTACVDPRAILGDEVEVGPYCVVGPLVRLGRGTRLVAHACVLGTVVLGERNLILPFVSIGAGPEGAGRVEIGDDNVFRESSTIARGSPRGELTRIGSKVTIEPGVRVGSDARLGDGATISAGASVGASVQVGGGAVIGPGVVLHGRLTIGESSYVAGPTRVIHDIPPYMLVDGQPPRVRGINTVGLKRARLAKGSIEALHEAHRLLYRARMEPAEAESVLESHGHLAPEVVRLLGFIRAQGEGRHGRARDRAREIS